MSSIYGVASDVLRNTRLKKNSNSDHQLKQPASKHNLNNIGLKSGLIHQCPITRFCERAKTVRSLIGITSMIIIPAIDLRGGHCVRLTQGQASAETVYSENPVVVAKRWYDEGAEMLHVVNLDAALGKNDAENLKALERILYEVTIPVQFGGGVRTLDDVKRLDELGATRIVIGTTAIENPVLLEHIIGEFGDTIVVGIDARDGKVALRGWEKLSAEYCPRGAGSVKPQPQAIDRRTLLDA